MASVRAIYSEPTSVTSLIEIDPAHISDYLKTYAANPLFRSAIYDEKIIEDNPYRRPVRPDDLSFIDYSIPITRDNAMELSSLIANRMLLNIYDSQRLLLPDQFTEERWEEFELFYSHRNRMLGEAVRPHLERHIFSFVEQETRDRSLPGSVGALRNWFREVGASRRTRANELFTLVEKSADPRQAAQMLAVQLLGSSLHYPLQLAPGMINTSTGAPAYGSVRNTEIERINHMVLEAAGLLIRPHRYYQFYLPSTMALMNYLNATSAAHSRVFRFMGAMCARSLESEAFLYQYGSALARICSPDTTPETTEVARSLIDTLVDDVITPAVQRWGSRALAEIVRGAEEYRTLLDVHDHDVTTQLTWLEATETCKAKAEKLQRAIVEHEIKVDLDTFVESWEECSTTHVHDEDRLLIIESGEMQFWNCMGGTHSFHPGDKFFVPKHRLHGSVVLSGKCVYHQPIITPELDRKFG